MDSFKHAVPTEAAGQANFQQCWYASFGMIYKFHGLAVASIDDKLSGGGIDVADAKATGLTAGTCCFNATIVTSRTTGACCSAATKATGLAAGTCCSAGITGCLSFVIGTSGIA